MEQEELSQTLANYTPKQIREAVYKSNFTWSKESRQILKNNLLK